MLLWGVGSTPFRAIYNTVAEGNPSPPVDLRYLKKVQARNAHVLSWTTSFLEELYESVAETLPDSLNDVDCEWWEDVLGETPFYDPGQVAGPLPHGCPNRTDGLCIDPGDALKVTRFDRLCAATGLAIATCRTKRPAMGHPGTSCCMFANAHKCNHVGGKPPDPGHTRASGPKHPPTTRSPRHSSCPAMCLPQIHTPLQGNS